MLQHLIMQHYIQPKTLNPKLKKSWTHKLTGVVDSVSKVSNGYVFAYGKRDKPTRLTYINSQGDCLWDIETDNYYFEANSKQHTIQLNDYHFAIGVRKRRGNAQIWNALVNIETGNIIEEWSRQLIGVRERGFYGINASDEMVHFSGTDLEQGSSYEGAFHEFTFKDGDVLSGHDHLTINYCDGITTEYPDCAYEGILGVDEHLIIYNSPPTSYDDSHVGHVSCINLQTKEVIAKILYSEMHHKAFQVDRILGVSVQGAFLYVKARSIQGLVQVIILSKKNNTVVKRIQCGEADFGIFMVTPEHLVISYMSTDRKKSIQFVNLTNWSIEKEIKAPHEWAFCCEEKLYTVASKNITCFA